MKEIEVKMWELTKEEAAQLSEVEQMIVYNPLTYSFKVEYGGKNCLARSKYAYSGLVYLTFNERRKQK